MTPEQLADIHARAFAGQGRAWSAPEVSELLRSPHIFLVCDGSAFAIGRSVADEAELLTVATDPAHQRQGLGRRVVAGFERQATARGATRVFLEVAVDNAAALALYQASGYREVARRSAYYAKPDGHRVDALILERTIA